MTFGIWEQDPLIVRQYAAHCGGERCAPEKRLLMAVLMDALQEFEATVRTSRRDDDPRLEELRAWFFGRDRAWLFAFENVCEQLDLRPDCIRARLTAIARASRRPKSVP